MESLKILDTKAANSSGLVALDLFAGCGGLALGFEAAGFHTIGMEFKKDPVETYNKNLSGECHLVNIDKQTTFPNADIVIGGPPCQPFSVGGKQSGLTDSRDGFPAFIEAVRSVKPKMWLFENVRGMLYRNKPYLMEVTKTLSELGYQISYKLFLASEFGVPQKRERIVVIGHLGGFKFPLAMKTKFTAGQAIGDIAYTVSDNNKILSPNQDKYIAKYEKASKCVMPRDLHLDKTARTVTCRNLAGATGDMLRVRLPDGRRKRLTVREGARLQSFPDWFEFTGNESSQFYQIGNAVPPMMALHIGNAMRNCLEGKSKYFQEDIHGQLELI